MSSLVKFFCETDKSVFCSLFFFFTTIVRWCTKVKALHYTALLHCTVAAGGNPSIGQMACHHQPPLPASAGLLFEDRWRQNKTKALLMRHCSSFLVCCWHYYYSADCYCFRRKVRSRRCLAAAAAAAPASSTVFSLLMMLIDTSSSSSS